MMRRMPSFAISLAKLRTTSHVALIRAVRLFQRDSMFFIFLEEACQRLAGGAYGKDSAQAKAACYVNGHEDM